MTVRQRELIESLTAVGLAPADAETYYHVAMAGQVKAAEVAQATGRRRPDVYPVLDRLIQQGLVQRTPGRPSMYVAVDIDQAMQRMTEIQRTRQQEMEKRAQELVQAWPRLREDLAPPVERMAFHEGLPQILATLKERVRAARHSVLAALSPRLLHRLGDVADDLVAAAEDRQVRVLTTLFSDTDAEALGAVAALDVRHLSLPAHLELVLIDSKEVFLFMSAGRADSTHGNIEQVLWLRTADVTLALQAIHDLLWAKGTPLGERIAQLHGEPSPATDLMKGRWVRDQRLMEAIARAEREVTVVADATIAEQWRRSGVWQAVLDRRDDVRLHVVGETDIEGLDVVRLTGPLAAAGVVVIDRHEALVAWRSEGAGADSLWTTHPDVVQLLLDGLPAAPTLKHVA